MSTYGYYRLAAAVPRVRVADVEYNTTELVAAAKTAAEQGATVVVFPELSITSAGCADLFFQPALLKAAETALTRFANETAELSIVSVVGLPLLLDDKLFNVAAVVQGGFVRGFVPKSIIPNKRESYERRQFSPAAMLTRTEVAVYGDFFRIPIGTDLLFEVSDELIFGVEIGDDATALLPPSTRLAMQGARVILNPAAAVTLAGRTEYTCNMVKARSGCCVAAYVHAGAGVGESTQDGVCGGAAMIAVNGRLLAQNTPFARESSVVYTDADMQRLGAARLSESSFCDNLLQAEWPEPRRVFCHVEVPPCDLRYAYLPARPFVPEAAEVESRCEEILNIQAAALAKRIECAYAKTLVIGVSGGLDSTLALLVCDRACKLLGRSNDCILALTMPGFGTTGRTYNNAVKMIELLGCTFKEVNIKEACLLHFKDLDFDPALRTNTYENVQARERTKLLMNLANKTGGMVVGTGDLSEIALGWATYNGDHMSMYGVNCSIPKSLIRCLIEYSATKASPELAAVLRDVNATPVSPELLPPSDDGKIDQKTEEILGPYDLHDFFLYHFIKYGAEPAKLRALAVYAFAGEYDEELVDSTLRMFLRRFFTQQFKRTCVPDGPKVGTIALSPRGDWRMPTDVCGNLWQWS
ncbi:MAG: NAD(+) synthase [Akkermansia sp.]|nr:NAD(+) synthase [Akkermansia sp.]